MKMTSGQHHRRHFDVLLHPRGAAARTHRARVVVDQVRGKQLARRCTRLLACCTAHLKLIFIFFGAAVYVGKERRMRVLRFALLALLLSSHLHRYRRTPDEVI